MALTGHTEESLNGKTSMNSLPGLPDFGLLVWMMKLKESCHLMSAQVSVDDGSNLMSSLARISPMRVLEKKPMQKAV